jgi:hypothetical protein
MFQGHREPGDLPETPSTYRSCASPGCIRPLVLGTGSLCVRCSILGAPKTTKAPHTCLYGGKPGTCRACAEIAMTPKDQDPWVTVGRFQFPNEPLGPLPRKAVAQVPHVHYDATEDEGSTL